ncbi:MAG: class I SAM-dependent methyltransferase [Nitratireductor sp.]
MSGAEDGEAFRQRREAMKQRIDPLDRHMIDGGDRYAFFNAVYAMAEGDAAGVPWADLKPKPQLEKWLAANPGNGRRAIDIACGLGDNAEALAAAGYRTTAFDLAEKAIAWARQRFPQSGVDYHVADIFNPPSGWKGGFDLVHECYTLQAVPPQMLASMMAAIADLVAPGGTLIVYTRIRHDGTGTSGPPWPLQESEAMGFSGHGFRLVSRNSFELVRPDRRIPHWFCIWQKTEQA